MKTLFQLYNGFYLNKESANSQISNCSDQLRVAPLKKTTNLKDLTIDYKHFSFAEKNNAWIIEYFHGLKNFLLIERPNLPPIFIFDNHNHALTFRYNIMYTKKIHNSKLIHIDQHSDYRENKNHLQLNRKDNELEKVFVFCNMKCNVWNFIPPAIECCIISDQIQIRSNAALKELNTKKVSDFFLDIDLDFCLEWINRNKINQESINLLKNKFDNIWKSAIWITIATSPYFLEQELAISIINNLLNSY